MIVYIYDFSSLYHWLIKLSTIKAAGIRQEKAIRGVDLPDYRLVMSTSRTESGDKADGANACLWCAGRGGGGGGERGGGGGAGGK